VRYKNTVSLGDRGLEHMTRVHIRKERERGAREWLAMMTGLADRVAAANGAAVPDDLRRMKLGRKLAEDTFNEAVAYFLEPLHDKRPELAARGYELLWNLMAGSFLIGASATMSESAKQKVDRDMKAVSAAFGALSGRGRKNKDDAATRWGNQGLCVALAYMAKHPSARRADVIRKIGKCDAIGCPGSKQIGKTVDAWRRDGKIKLEQ
jgi:hypothetical protein